MTPTNPEQDAMPVRQEPTNPMALIASAVERGVSAETMEKLYALQREWKKDQAAEAFAVALAEFQRVCPSIKKVRAASFGEGKAAYKYASLDDVMRVIAPHLAANGLSVTADVEHGEGGNLTIITCITKGIHERRSKFTCPVPKEMRVNDTQKMGAAMKYARRYGLEAALNLTVTDEDSDGMGLGEMRRTITAEQAIQIKTLLTDTHSDVERFLIAAGAETVEQMGADRFPTMLAMLQDKKVAQDRKRATSMAKDIGDQLPEGKP